MNALGMTAALRSIVRAEQVTGVRLYPWQRRHTLAALMGWTVAYQGGRRGGRYAWVRVTEQL